MLNALDVSKFFLRGLSSPDTMGDIISNLKLQKLLYYAQGIHLALTDGPLFKEDIVKWEYGPVVVEVYNEYKNKGVGSGALPIPDYVDASLFSKSEKNSIYKTYNEYGQYSAWRLSQMTHKELPWKETKFNEVIQHNLLIRFFKSELL